MIVWTKNANETIYNTFCEYLGRRNSYGPPPIFYWFRNIIAEVQNIDTYTDIATGSHKYNMSDSLGVVYYTCKYVKTQRVIIITDFEFNQTTINMRVYSGRVNRQKRTIKLKESQLRQIIYEVVRRLLCA